MENLDRQVSPKTVDPEVLDLEEAETMDDHVDMDLLMETMEADLNHHHLMEKSIVLYRTSSRS